MGTAAIVLESPAKQETIDLLDRGLDAYNLAFGMAPFEEFSLSLKTATAKLGVGSLSAADPVRCSSRHSGSTNRIGGRGTGER